MTPSTTGALASSTRGRMVSTTELNEQQIRLHLKLPMRNGARIITISADVLLKTDKLETLSWRNDEIPMILMDLSYIADVYLLYKVSDTTEIEHIDRIRDFISMHPHLKSNATTAGGIQAHKILFCTTSIGKIAFVRQIEPHVHVDVDANVVRDLEKHVPYIVHISTSREGVAVPLVPNVVHVGDSFSSYFSLISSKERL
ncbi:unnamed protein product [Peronospora belbahrii]|nr:unnamed protein product [Peronospora belbahrii]